MSTADPLDPSSDFIPAPRRERHDGWTAERQRTFIRALAETGSVTAAAAEAGVTPRSAYRLRIQPDARAFTAAWDRALRVATGHLVALAFERAVNGVPRQKWRNGELVEETRMPSERMLTFLLTRLDRRRFGPCDAEHANVDYAVHHANKHLPGELDALADIDAIAPTLIAAWPDLPPAPDTGWSEHPRPCDF